MKKFKVLLLAAILGFGIVSVLSRAANFPPDVPGYLTMGGMVGPTALAPAGVPFENELAAVPVTGSNYVVVATILMPQAGECKRLWATVTVATQALSAFKVEVQPTVNSGWITIAASAGAYQVGVGSPPFPILGCDSALYTAAAGTTSAFAWTPRDSARSGSPRYQRRELPQ